MDSRFSGVAVCMCVCAVGDAGSGVPGLLQPVGRRDDEGLQPANEIVDYTNVHFHSRSHIHPACRKLGVVDVWRDQGNRLYGGGHHLDGAVRLRRSGHMEDHLGDDT